MRYPRPRRREVRKETIIFTGGLNTTVTDLELAKGELYQCINYVELDGEYHGYASMKGYEVFDGKSLASEVAAPALPDGLDDNTVFLLEAGEYDDISIGSHEVINNGSVVDTTIRKFPVSSFYLKNTNIEVVSQDAGEFDDSFDDEAFSKEVTGEKSYLNLGADWTIDFQIKPQSRITQETIFEKPDCYRLFINIDGTLTFQYSSTGASFDYSINWTNIIPTNKFSHISIVSKSNVISLAVDGLPNVSTLTGPAIHNSVSNLFIGGSAIGMYIDEFRISDIYRWITTFTPPIERYSVSTFNTIRWDDADREAHRATIQPVGYTDVGIGDGSGPTRGVHIYDGEVYALRDSTDGTKGILWKANETGDDGTAGWVQIDNTFNPGGNLSAINEAFVGQPQFGNGAKVMIMCDGVSVPRIWDGSTMTVLDPSYKETSGGAADGPASVLPDNQVSPRYAKVVNTFDNRVLFGYEEDDLWLSSKIDAGDFTNVFDQQLNVGDDINNLIELPGEAMGVICRNSIKVLEKLEIPTGATGTAPLYSFRVRTLSKTAGGFLDTAEQILGNVIYADDRGIINLAATDKYGDFETAAISKKVNRIYLRQKDIITTSIVDKVDNQYRLYFSDGSGLVFTFTEGEVKGASYVKYPVPVLHAAEGEDKQGELRKVFGCSTGYVYLMDSGTSFNGEDIETRMVSSFYHYKSPREWKQFMRAMFEITASLGTQFYVRTVFDYDSALLPETLEFMAPLQGAGGTWDEDNWNEFLWSGSAVQRIIHYIRGHGANMSLEVTTIGKHTEQHIVHNCIVDYMMENKQE